MKPHYIACLLSTVALGACVVSTDDDPNTCAGGKCDDSSVSQTCGDNRYADGRCDLHLDCAVPDVDCFQTFASDADAAAWWRTNQMRIAGVSLPIIAPTDPRFAAVRKSLDDGWDAFKVRRPVGKLADARPALVLVDSPLQMAAFVAGDAQNNTQPLIVFVESATLTFDVDDDARLGVMMHELQHAVGLHLIGDGKERIRKFYTAPAGTEPLGRIKPDDANVRRVGEAWRVGAQQVGPYSSSQLGGLPTGGQFNQWLTAVVNAAVQHDPARCTQSVQQLGLVQQAIGAKADALDGSLPDLSSATATIDAAMIAVRDQCLAGFPDDVIEVAAALTGTTPAQLEAQLAPYDVALVKGRHFIDGIYNLVVDRRMSMREAEQEFTNATHQPFSQLRYFSYEEDADDVSAIVMRGAGRPPASMATFLSKMLPAPSSKTCDDQIATWLPGYGVDLTDEHHSTCWRIGHLRREGKTVHIAPTTTTGTVTVRMPGTFPAPRSLAENLAN